MASQTWATPGVYASDRSSRPTSGTVDRISILPPTWRSKTGDPSRVGAGSDMACQFLTGASGRTSGPSSMKRPHLRHHERDDVAVRDGPDRPRVHPLGGVVALDPPAAGLPAYDPLHGHHPVRQ